MSTSILGISAFLDFRLTLPPAARMSRVVRAVRRNAKRVRQRFRSARFLIARRPKVAVFVVGCQRSGTNMLLGVLARAPECRAFNENDPAAFREYLLRDDAIVRALIADSPEPVVAFKPLFDSHRTGRLLSLHPNAKAIWIYRDYRDVARSEVQQWGSALRDIMLAIAYDAGPVEGQVANREGLTEDGMAVVRALADPSLTAEEGALLHWYARNRIYFDFGLDTEQRVLPVKYEELVRKPVICFRRIFDFVGMPFAIKYTRTVQSNRIGKGASVVCRPSIERHCSQLLDRLDSCHRGRW